MKVAVSSSSLNLPLGSLSCPQKLNAILDISKAMAAEHPLEDLLLFIADNSARLVEAECASVFVLDEAKAELFSFATQGANGEIRFPVGVGLAGHVAQTGKTLRLENAYADSRFNNHFCTQTNCQPKSALCVPLLSHTKKIIGVLQLLNSTKGIFSEDDERLCLVLGEQAAMAIENAVLVAELGALFRGFVQASVLAVESRDSNATGHSSRVATLSVNLAKAVGEKNPKQKLPKNELIELYYAALLHDFGKVGIYENTLTKPFKLHHHELEAIRTRIELVKKERETEYYRRCLSLALRAGSNAWAHAEALEKERLDSELAQLDEALQLIESSNIPNLLPVEDLERLQILASLTYPVGLGKRTPLLKQQELEALSIAQGTLSSFERKTIESHVELTARFLERIPWSRSLARIPAIAKAHHERLDGSGYPLGISANEVLFQSRIIALCDVYDALTAVDRPYKKAVPHEQALNILQQEAKKGRFDAELLAIFIDANVGPASAQTYTEEQRPGNNQEKQGTPTFRAD
ncbi:MAG: GAF domain-containing protein [Proteobacteria bacterium]|nr:GAF domain-containing protein [Cystobacterineae bacterium]MCL2259093.1 GAF domain-containing protein [Cystobacterineae bacterium]MCL2314486.1 GAF domain-containing protein [Pseudomonadota bacterium]